MDGNETERDSVENVFFFSFNIYFLFRER